MAWCPKCKMEYREGILECAECKIPLVDELQEQKVSCLQGSVEMIDDIMNYISSYEDILTAEVELLDNNEAKILIAEKEVNLMIDTIKLYLKDCEEEVAEDGESDRIKPQSTGVYESAEYKAKENMSSSIILMILGGLGMVFLLLCKLHIINLFMNSMFFIVMFVVFLICISGGGYLFLQAKKMNEGVEIENTLVLSVKGWVRENLKQSEIDDLLQCVEDEEELKYFKRTQYMKQQINHQFVNLEETFVDHYVDELYEEIFDN